MATASKTCVSGQQCILALHLLNQPLFGCTGRPRVCFLSTCWPCSADPSLCSRGLWSPPSPFLRGRSSSLPLCLIVRGDSKRWERWLGGGGEGGQERDPDTLPDVGSSGPAVLRDKFRCKHSPPTHCLRDPEWAGRSLCPRESVFTHTFSAPAKP